MEYISKTLDILKKTLGENHPYTKSIQKNMDDVEFIYALLKSEM